MTEHSDLFRDLLDPRVAVHEVDVYSERLTELFAAEAAQLSGAHPDRLREFRAGRHCARAAMAALGIEPSAILRGQDRAPIFPRGVVGSITHTRDAQRGISAAAMARQETVRGVGIDVEPNLALDERLWRKVLSPAEREWVAACPEPGIAARLVFSAKEATYKCQYALSHQFLEFRDVEMTFDPDQRVFTARLLRVSPPFSVGHLFRGRMARHGEWLGTGVTC